MVAIECGDDHGGGRFPADWWGDVLLASTKGRGVMGLATTVEAQARFRKTLDSLGISAGVLRDESELAEARCLIARSPATMARHAWARQALTRDGAGATAWSIVTAVDETTVVQSVASLARLVTLPVYAWDAIICSSYQVRRQVLWIFRAQMAQIQQRFGVSRLVLPRVEVIRPGLHGQRSHAPDLFIRTISRERRDGDIVILVRDRDEEVNALRQALACLAAEDFDLGDVLVVQAGTEAIDLEVSGVRALRLESSCDRAFGALCREVDIVCMLPSVSAAADAQDVLLAARAGAAIIASDLGLAADLCRFCDAAIVRPDAAGIKVKTWCAPAGEDSPLALLSGMADDDPELVSRLINVSAGRGRTWPERVAREVAGLSTIDVGDLAGALRALLVSPELRAALGERAAALVGHNSWSEGSHMLVALHEKLRGVADEARSKPLAALPDPAHADPLHLQEASVTCTLQPDTRLALAEGLDATAPVAAIVKMAGLLFKASRLDASRVLPTHEDLAAVIECFKGLPAQAWPGLPARDAVAGVAAERQLHVFRSLVWCVRIGLLRILGEPAVAEVPERDDKFGLYAERPRG